MVLRFGNGGWSGCRGRTRPLASGYWTLRNIPPVADERVCTLLEEHGSPESVLVGTHTDEPVRIAVRNGEEAAEEFEERPEEFD